MKEYLCIEVKHHNKIAETILSHSLEGWRLHTYQAAGSQYSVSHYLLFERG